MSAILAQNSPRLVLASTSRYRRDLLQRLRIPFETAAPDVDETPQDHEIPAQTAQRLALCKAENVAQRYHDALVIGSDQVASFQGQALSKPGNHTSALAQLRAFQGQRIVFHTALCVWHTASKRYLQTCVDTCVEFRRLSEAELDRYLQLEQPYDCAGSAKSEALGVALIERIEGADPNALVGLPLIALISMLREFGYSVLEHAQ